MPLLSTFGAASVKGFGGGLFQSSADVAEAVEFVANSSGYISRTSNLSGISDGKNVLFSGWLYKGRVATDTWFFIATSAGSNRVYISADDNDQLYCYFMTSGGTENVVVIQSRRTYGAGVPTGAWTHVMFSFNAANSSQRHVYINGEVPADLSYSSYNNLDIGMANPRFALSGDISETDQYAAKSQFITHVIGQIVSQLKIEPTPIDTKSYSLLREIRKIVGNDSSDLFRGLSVYNKYTKTEFEKILEIVDGLKTTIIKNTS